MSRTVKPLANRVVDAWSRHSVSQSGTDVSAPPAEVGAIAPGRDRDYRRDFWAGERHKFVEPHFRMRKLAREVRHVIDGRPCDLLDIGCGPATLERLVPPVVRYHGIDIAVPTPAPHLLEMDILADPIRFSDLTFDVIVAQGLFEYVGQLQSQKLGEIAALLKPDGTFIVTYTNFAHRNTSYYYAFSNVQRPEEFRADLRRHFEIKRHYAGSHNWNHGQPNKSFMRLAQARLNVDIPVISPILAVDYFYVCVPLSQC